MEVSFDAQEDETSCRTTQRPASASGDASNVGMPNRAGYAGTGGEVAKPVTTAPNSNPDDEFSGFGDDAGDDEVCI